MTHAPARRAARTHHRPLPQPRPYEVRRSAIQGRGAFATRAIRTGQKVDEYLGQRISHEEADRRYDDADGRHHTFLFILDEDTVLDARYGGNDARYLNHSCAPNCETEIEHGRIFIKALRPIRPGEELTYDYRFEWQDDYGAQEVRYYRCRCGTPACRGTILRVPRRMQAQVKAWLAEPARKRLAGKKATGKKATGKKAAKPPGVAKRARR
jgi:hypothetical protein